MTQLCDCQIVVSYQTSGKDLIKNMIFGMATSIDLLNFIISRQGESNSLGRPLLSPVPFDRCKHTHTHINCDFSTLCFSVYYNMILYRFCLR